MSSKEPSVAEYYNNNTKRFLRLGQNQRTRNIHQPLWAPQVATLEEAVNWSNTLVLGQIESVAKGAEEVRVLDLGCGVGSSLFYLAAAYARAIRLWGVSISDVQVDLARQFAQGEPRGGQCEFLCRDFLSLPELPAMDLVFSIEAFVHATSAEGYFRSVADVLRSGGRLVLIDDVLSERGAENGLGALEQGWIDEFRSGWLASSLISLARIESLAAAVGMRLVHSQNLTGFMRLGRPRDKGIGLMRKALGPYMRRSTYLRSLSGGYAKQQCLKTGLVEYRMLGFEAAT